MNEETHVNASANAISTAGAAATRLLHDLEVALSRWIGREGYSALLVNAARLTLPEHPVLETVLKTGGPGAATPSHDDAESDTLARGMTALLEILIELLGRIIGEEMAARLVDQAGAPSPRGSVSNVSHEKRDEQVNETHR